MKLATAVLLLLVAAPASAFASPTSLSARELPPGVNRATSAVPFQLVGVHWRGAGRVELRTRVADGPWSAWRAAAPEPDGPDAGGSESSVRGWRVGNPHWVDRADRVQIRRHGSVTRVRVHLVRAAPSPAPPRSLAVAQAPPVILRPAWGAPESVRRDNPEYASRVRIAVVHHTAGTNTYTRAQSAGIVRGIMLYHVRSNGWDDIGYNFLVDKYGQVFEGRYGGIDRNVVGAHAGGFNDGTVGIAVIGTYGSARISAAAQAAVTRLIAWRLDLAHADPLAVPTHVSSGNERYPRGAPVILRGVVGHRETGYTSCPGDGLMGQLGAIARGAAASGGPKLFDPAVSGAIGRPVRFTGRLSAVLPWTVTVTDAARNVVAAGQGTGSRVDWTWDTTGVAAGAYTWTIGAGPTVRPASGVLRSTTGAVLALSALRAAPAAFTPNADGRDDTTAISYVLGAQATVTASLYDAGGRLLAALFNQPQAAGRKRFVFTAANVADGRYRIALAAVDARGREVRGEVWIQVSRTLSGLTPSRPGVSPNGDGIQDTIAFRLNLAMPAEVRLRVLRRGAWVATPFTGLLGSGAHELTWNGRKRLGRPPDGAYEAEVRAVDHVGPTLQRVPFVVDTRGPRLSLASVRPLRLRVDEPAELVAQVDGRRIVVRAPRAGTVAIPGAAAPWRVRVIGRDAYGNRGLPLRYPAG
jgi:hypothetical protein